MAGKKKINKTKIQEDHPLFELVSSAYKIFEGPKPSSTGVCENWCCLGQDLAKRFFDDPIERLPEFHLKKWYLAAGTEEGVPHAVRRYLMPRILELLVLDRDISLGIELVLERFEVGKPENWRPDERKFLDRFQREYLNWSMSRLNGELDGILCMFVKAGWSIEDLWQQALSVSDELLICRLWFDWAKFKPDAS